MKPDVTLCEVGPRDGFQFEAVPIPTKRKLKAIRGLLQAGVPQVQAVSFVHPRRVPQMADAERVAEALIDGGWHDRISGLALNRRGVERARAAGLSMVDLSIATHPQHARDNANMTVQEGVDEAVTMLDMAASAGMHAQIGLQTVWGYAQPGDVPLDEVMAIIERVVRLAPESLSLADSTGLANPSTVRSVLQAVRGVVGDTPLVLHLHDTRGLGLANVAAALDEGVRRFDTSLGGLGGCPFIPGASGNIATEDTIWMLEQMGYRTGVDLPAVARVTRSLETLLGHPFDGKLYRLPSWIPDQASSDS